MGFATLFALALSVVAAGSWWLLRARRMTLGNWAAVIALAVWVVGIAAAQWWPKSEASVSKSTLVQSLDSLAWPVAPTSPLVEDTASRSISPASADGSKAAPVESLIGGLEARLQANPEDASGWSLLAQSYAYMDNEEAVENALQHAVALGVDEQSLRARVDQAMRSVHSSDWVGQTLRVSRKP